MRVNIGQTFSLFNESGEWEAKIKDIKKGNVEFLVIKKLRSANNEREIWLAFAPIKLNYLNLMIQKATELGVTKFIPILTPLIDDINQWLDALNENTTGIETTMPWLEDLVDIWMVFGGILPLYMFKEKTIKDK